MSGKVCAMFGCNNYELLKFSKSFFRFPRDKAVCDRWVLLCQRSDLDEIYRKEGPAYLNKTYKVCSDHFKLTDFRNPALYSQGLKPGSVPSENLPSSSIPHSPEFSRSCRPHKRKREEKEAIATCSTFNMV